MEADYYEILGVSTDASVDEVKKAYRRMALRWHPDKHPTDKAIAEQRFKRISEAFQVLSDSSGRRCYDQERLKRSRHRCQQPPEQTPRQDCPPQHGNTSTTTTTTTETFTGTFAYCSAEDLLRQLGETMKSRFAFRDAEDVFREFFADANNNTNDTDDNATGSGSTWKEAFKGRANLCGPFSWEPTETVTKTTQIGPDGNLETITTITRVEVCVNFENCGDNPLDNAALKSDVLKRIAALQKQQLHQLSA